MSPASAIAIPETCARGKDAFAVFVQKAEFGARMLMDLVQNKTGAGAAADAAEPTRLESPLPEMQSPDAAAFAKPIRFDMKRFAGHAQSGRSRRGLVGTRLSRHLSDTRTSVRLQDLTSLAAPRLPRARNWEGLCPFPPNLRAPSFVA